MPQAPATPRISTETTDRDRLSAPGLRAFFRITKSWGLTGGEQRVLLGDIPESTFYKWKKYPQVQLSHDTLERISYVLGIYKALQILFPNPDQADAWVKRPNSAPGFGGGSALDRMLAGNVADMYVVRRHLDAYRGV